MKKRGIDRRSFLKGLTMGGALAALGTTPKKVRAKGTKEIPNQTLYRETEDFRKYYESLR